MADLQCHAASLARPRHPAFLIGATNCRDHHDVAVPCITKCAMIERIGTQGHETISLPNPNATVVIQTLLAAGNKAPMIAEIGVGIGATTLVMAALLDNAGELHLYDFNPKVDELLADLTKVGFTNIRGFGNTNRHWDSYNWTLSRMILDGKRDVYDYIYIDGAHTFGVDALAFVLCDRLLKPEGYLEFDDYSWSFSKSHWMQDIRDQFMTDEQACTPQVKMVVDLFLNGNAEYTSVQPNRLYRKAASHAAACGVAPKVELIEWRGQRFRVIEHPAVTAALTEFRSAFEAGTLQFFDAALASCDRMVDVGAHVGLMSLYAAGRVSEVFAFEASPTNFKLLSQNVAVNEPLRDRMRLFGYGLGDRDQRVLLYRKGIADSGSSIFRTVERGAMVNGEPEATVELRDANTALRELGINGRTLLKIDIEGAEYLVVPAIAALLAEAKPFLHLSFHPFNLVVSDDEYLNALMRIQRSLLIAEPLASYRYMYFYVEDRWHIIERSDRMIFLREYLLRAKPVPRIMTPQYGFIDAIGFSDVALPALNGAAPMTLPAHG
jgi:FkbM family methyltransferase